MAEALDYRANRPSDNATLLTDDSNLMLTARESGLPYTAIPAQWLLPPEPDSRDKTLAQLQREITALKREHPALELRAIDATGAPVDYLQLHFHRHRRLSNSEIDALVNDVTQLFPVAPFGFDSGPLAAFAGLRVPTQADVQRYLQIDYPGWVETVRQTFDRIPALLGQFDESEDVLVTLNNDSSHPAERLIVEFKAVGGLEFAPPGSKVRREREKVALPLPPDVPGRSPSRNESNAASYLDPLISRALGRPWQPPPRDPYKFYWRERPKGSSDTWVFECEEFRHKVAPQTFTLAFLPPAEDVGEAAVLCRVTASNLPDPLRLTFKARVVYIDEDTQAVARGLITHLAQAEQE